VVFGRAEEPDESLYVGSTWDSLRILTPAKVAFLFDVIEVETQNFVETLLDDPRYSIAWATSAEDAPGIANRYAMSVVPAADLQVLHELNLAKDLNKRKRFLKVTRNFSDTPFRQAEAPVCPNCQW